jgi:S-adenosylmethionine:tRNA ribosyltransferase-isomerase
LISPLNLDDYDYVLPPELIADRPLARRDQARLLVFDEETGSITHSTFAKLAEHLPRGASLFFNQSRVIPCRVLAQRLTGAKVEVFFLSIAPIDSRGESHYQVLLKSSSKKRIGDRLKLPGELEAEIKESLVDGSFVLSLDLKSAQLESYLNQYGMIPIPPYIREGQSDQLDREDYQTVYSKELGSVAAPTAGLHFTDELLESLGLHECKLYYPTLHVGLGTFKPLTDNELTQKRLHSESYRLGQKAKLGLLNDSFRVAVGTTSLRAMESAITDAAWPEGDPEQWKTTEIFLYPGVEVRSVEALITNFHLPKSSLLMLVSALIGREQTLSLYEEAIMKQYRFFSYGDGMLIKRRSFSRTL